MSNTALQLDKSFNAPIGDDYGTIVIRVVVVDKTIPKEMDKKNVEDDTPVDLAPDEILPDDSEKSPVATFLEKTKRGSQCCVFLINGQRQHAWDNQFIVRDLDMKYLRKRMVVVVDCDGLKQGAIARLMQGSRHGFLDGTVYSALEARVIATLKGDPDLRRLEEEAEEEISNLEAGDEAVKAALDQLIDEHHDASSHLGKGGQQPGENSEDGLSGPKARSESVVVSSDQQVGVAVDGPTLHMRPELITIRLKPNEKRCVSLYTKPDEAWSALQTAPTLRFDPPIKELQVVQNSQLAGSEIELTFVEPEEFDPDEYPIHTVMRCHASFENHTDNRYLERRIVINRSKNSLPPSPAKELKDDPTFIKVTSRQPFKVVMGGPDIHVKLKWDGKDTLAAGMNPSWTMRVTCEATGVEPKTFLTSPVNGRFELLIQVAPDLKLSDQLKFNIEAIGPGKTLTTGFVADVVQPPFAQKVITTTPFGGQRRPPYELRYITQDKWSTDTNWAQTWTKDDAGSFAEPSGNSALVIFINQDMELLAAYRENLLAKKHAENVIQQRINKYTAHVAFHLYQMYQNKKKQPVETAPTEEQMRDEVRRVSHTLLKLMEV